MGHGMSATIKELFNVDSDRGQHLTTMDLKCSTDCRSGSVSGRRQKEASLLGKHSFPYFWGNILRALTTSAFWNTPMCVALSMTSQ